MISLASAAEDCGPMTLPQSIQQRAVDYFEAQNRQVCVRTDRQFAVLLVLQWAFAIVLSLPTTLRPTLASNAIGNDHFLLATLLGGWLTAFPVYLAWRSPGLFVTRAVIAVAQALWTALLIHLTWGRIETHFHVFGSLAFLSVYRDWRVLIISSLVVAADHLTRALICPELVYGSAVFPLWRTAEHVGWVLFEDVFLLGACVAAVRDAKTRARQHAELEASHELIAAEVAVQTQELKRRETEANSLAEAAQAASRAKSQFLANMSHEIRTPMTAILGYADILVEDGDLSQAPPSRIESLQTIRRNGEHLLYLINDILDLSKIEAGEVKLEILACDPVQLLHEVQALMQVRAAEKHLELSLEVAPEVLRQIDTDPTRLRQILINVIGNAIKFTPAGSVSVTASLEARDPAQLLVDIRDTGVGMTAEQQLRLFHSFSQADNSMTRRFGGTGLGLVISRRLAQMLGGDLVVVRSQPNVGTTFRLCVPAVTSRVIPPPANLRVEAPPVAAAPARSLEGYRVLVADDVPENQRILERMLRNAGAEASVVENGQEAIELTLAAVAEGRPFDVILMDMQMPVVSGYEATERLRAQGYDRPIIALTAHSMQDEVEKILALGCDDHCAKPVNRSGLIACISRQVNHFSSRRMDHLATLAGAR